MDPNGWFPLGPSCLLDGEIAQETSSTGPAAGRVSAIAIDPNDPQNSVYIGTPMGGVWRTTDAGISWTPLTDDHPSLSVGAMRIHPNQPNRLYVAAGEGIEGTPVFSGSGVTIYDPAVGAWSFRNDSYIRDMRSSGIALDSRGPNTSVYLACTKGLLYSPDDGVNWRPLDVIGGVGTPPGATGVILHQGPQAADERLYVALSNGGIYRRNGGAGAFTRLDAGLPPLDEDVRISLAICRDQPLNLYAAVANAAGEISGLFRTSNGGEWWASLRLPDGAGLFRGRWNLALQVHPANPDWAFFGELHLWRTHDGGQDWRLVSEPVNGTPGLHSDQQAITFDPVNPDRIWAGNDGGIWLSVDGGDTWHHRNRGLQNMQYYSLAQHPVDETILMAGAQDNGTQRFTGHPGWRLIGPDDGFYCAIDQQEPRYWYRSYFYRRPLPDGMIDDDPRPIYRSDQAGAPDSWTLIRDGIDPGDITDFGGFNARFVLDPRRPGVLYLGTTKLYRSENRGDSWTAVETAPGIPFERKLKKRSTAITAIAIDPEDSDFLYLGTEDGKVYFLQRQADGLFTSVSHDLPSPYFVGDIQVSRTPAGGSKTVYAALGSAHRTNRGEPEINEGRIFRWDGNAWIGLGQAALNLHIHGHEVNHKSNPVNTIALDPANPTHIYIGCDRGVFKSEDQGANWIGFGENLPNTAVVDLQLHAAKRLLRAATLGRGAWERNLDAGHRADAKILLRDNVGDFGRELTPADAPDPLRPGQRVAWSGSIDIKVDTPFPVLGDFAPPASTVDYNTAGPMDYIGFELLSHSDPRHASRSKVYVQVQTRGPDNIDAVRMRVFYGVRGAAGYPELPPNFWQVFPDGDPDGQDWRPVGPAQDIAHLRPGDPQVVAWDWDVPSGLDSPVGLLAVGTSAGDPVAENRRVVETIARENRHIALREMDIGHRSANFVVGGALVLLGIAALGSGIVLILR